MDAGKHDRKVRMRTHNSYINQLVEDPAFNTQYKPEKCGEHMVNSLVGTIVVICLDEQGVMLVEFKTLNMCRRRE